MNRRIVAALAVLAAGLMALPALAQNYGTIPAPVTLGSGVQTLQQGQTQPAKPDAEKPAVNPAAPAKPAEPAPAPAK
ncbi:MAG: hypothetical protein H7841_15555 [Magnetospirillum sp. WYHS-4]